jgi:hypothetical protein
MTTALTGASVLIRRQRALLSHNTVRLNEDSTVEVLRQIPEVRAELDALAAEVLAI